MSDLPESPFDATGRLRNFKKEAVPVAEHPRLTPPFELCIDTLAEKLTAAWCNDRTAVATCIRNHLGPVLAKHNVGQKERT